MPSHYYVDPAAGQDNMDAGRGEVSTPWLSTQYALNNITRDTDDGDQINIKVGTDDALTAPLDIQGGYAAITLPTDTAPLTFAGYVADENDIDGTGADIGVRAGISGAGLYQIIATADWGLDYIKFNDLHLHSSGSQAYLIRLDNWCEFYNCEFSNFAGTHCCYVDAYTVFDNCYWHDCSGQSCVLASTAQKFLNCYFKVVPADTLTRCIWSNGSALLIDRNIFSTDGATQCVYSNDAIVMTNNSFLAPSATPWRAIHAAAAGQNVNLIRENLIEGFGTNGAINLFLPARITRFVKNTVINQGVGFGPLTGVEFGYGGGPEGGNEELTTPASPFAKIGADTFENRFNYFSPLVVGNNRLAGAVAPPTRQLIDPGMGGGISG